MPDSRQHRGQHPSDAALFGPAQLPRLQQAVSDLSWLLSRGYSERSSLKLVGDRYRLSSRQRLGVGRSSCSRQAAFRRGEHRLPEEAMRANTLHIDGFNLLITVESALSGGFILEGVDDCLRDMASIHGSYRRVLETEGAIQLAGQALQQLGVERAVWCLDRPVSNSGRLRQAILDSAARQGWRWEVSLLDNPDTHLKKALEPVASSDSVVLDHASRWFNLARFIVHQFVPGALILPLGQLARTELAC